MEAVGVPPGGRAGRERGALAGEPRVGGPAARPRRARRVGAARPGGADHHVPPHPLRRRRRPERHPRAPACRRCWRPGSPRAGDPDRLPRPRRRLAARPARAGGDAPLAGRALRQPVEPPRVGPRAGRGARGGPRGGRRPGGRRPGVGGVHLRRHRGPQPGGGRPAVGQPRARPARRGVGRRAPGHPRGVPHRGPRGRRASTWWASTGRAAIDPAALGAAVRDDTALACVVHGQPDIGTLQDVPACVAAVRAARPDGAGGGRRRRDGRAWCRSMPPAGTPTRSWSAAARWGRRPGRAPCSCGPARGSTP